ncbi:ThiJ/PfpI [Mycena metata]|uniref:ThiJ/PfpI n=1 Tax=Mycena metata TaxID=1033252 RepID=A0AAD7NYM4_9AGAR|nr:ThiJ/PfpI [Mycena metata]
MPAVLFVLTSASKTLTGAQTGYLPEAAHPYYVLAPHATIDFASPAGPNPPIDEGSIKAFESDAECKKFLADETVKGKLASAKKLSDISVKDYDAIFYVGGHGPVIDLPVDQTNIRLASEVGGCVDLEPLFSPFVVLPSRKDHQRGLPRTCVSFEQNRKDRWLIPCSRALVGATDAEGKSIFAGKAFTGFSNAEETQVGKVKDIPFLLEDKITSLGGKYEKADEAWAVGASFSSTRRALIPESSPRSLSTGS